MAQTSFTSRAIVRFVEAGNSANCVTCGDLVQFRARIKTQQVICNVYTDGRWDRVEHYHRECYDAAGHPFGEADESQPLRPKHRSAANAAAAAAAATAEPAESSATAAA